MRRPKQFQLPLVSLVLLLVACDPMHQSRTTVKLGALANGATTKMSVDGDAEEAVAIVARVAKEFDFQKQPILADHAAQGCRVILTRSYAKYPEQGMYCHLAIVGSVKPGESFFDVTIWEFVASRESEMGRRVRMAILKGLVARFGADHVQSKG